mmetsp:Transcript_4156/g.6972  ORF Transcript_4156/g.6972 Transcript_4156/m.6972 type:complete len:97 (-) Transcript_4156:67-357(-)
MLRGRSARVKSLEKLAQCVGPHLSRRTVKSGEKIRKKATFPCLEGIESGETHTTGWVQKWLPGFQQTTYHAHTPMEWLNLEPEPCQVLRPAWFASL